MLSNQVKDYIILQHIFCMLIGLLNLNIHQQGLKMNKNHNTNNEINTQNNKYQYRVNMHLTLLTHYIFRLHKVCMIIDLVNPSIIQEGLIKINNNYFKNNIHVYKIEIIYFYTG